MLGVRTDLTAVAAVVLTLVSSQTWARTAAAVIQVSATVAPLCTIVVDELSFGEYDPFVANADAALDASAVVSVTCTKGLASAVRLDAGAHGGAGNVRHLASGGQRLAYWIFKDQARTAAWRTGQDGMSLPDVSTGQCPQSVALFGRIPPGQVVPSGAYTDTVMATLDF